jgi:hypothetical protein
MASEFKSSVVTTILLVLTFVFPRARVMTVPLFFVLVLILLFWVARIGAERADKVDHGDS